MRRLYAAMLPLVARRPIHCEKQIPFEVFSYSGEATLPEQVASIRSFLRFAGRPKEFTVVSDGTYTQRSRALIERIDPCVRVAGGAAWRSAKVPQAAAAYLAEHPTGKQLALIMSLPRNGPALYVDSDVLFFPGARALSALTPSAPVLYLADCRLSADERLYRDEQEKRDPVNTGVLFLNRPIDWWPAIQRLLELNGEPTFFTNQTLTHLALAKAGAAPLDSARFVLQLDDQFEWSDRHASPEIVLRHYVNPVRHKFWSTLAQQFFRL